MDAADGAVARALSAIEGAGGLVTPSAFAAEIGVTPATVSRWIAAGRFPEPVFAAGRVKLYLRAQLKEFTAPS